MGRTRESAIGMMMMLLRVLEYGDMDREMEHPSNTSNNHAERAIIVAQSVTSSKQTVPNPHSRDGKESS